MTDIALTAAKTIADAAISRAASFAVTALSVVVLDRAGATRLIHRSDAGSLFGPEIALAKAKSAMAFRLPTTALNQSFGDNPTLTAAVAAATGGKFLPLGGGIPVFGGDGTLIGAVGVAGSSQDNDHAIACAAVEAAGLSYEPKKAG